MWVWYACGKQRSTLCLESGSLIGLELAEKASMAGQGAQGWPCLFLSNAGVAMRHDACMGAGVTMRHNACMGPGVTMRHGCWGYNETWCLHGCWGPNSDLHACMAYFALWTIFLFSGFTKGCLCSHAMEWKTTYFRFWHGPWLCHWLTTWPRVCDHSNPRILNRTVGRMLMHLLG